MTINFPPLLPGQAGTKQMTINDPPTLKLRRAQHEVNDSQLKSFNSNSMIKQILSLALLLFAICLNSSSQADTKPDTASIIEKAGYPKDALTDYLSKNLDYPDKALENNIQGDVIFSLVISTSGKMEKLVKLNSPHMLLLNGAVVLLSPLDKGWTPAKINGLPVDRSYRIVIRYRLNLNSAPVDYNRQIKELLRKEKYEKALKISNQAIEDNKYEYMLYEFRSKAKQFLGDTEGAKADSLTAADLNNDILLNLNIVAVGIVRKPMVIGTSVQRVN